MKKIHLGCGVDYKKGWINCDISEEVNPDMIVDLEEKLPFIDNSIDEVIINHALEHVTNFIQCIHELHRICKNGSIIKIKVPFYSSWGQFNDPTHVRFFTPFTFDYFKKGMYSHEVGCNKDMFDILETKLNFGLGTSSKLNFLFNPLININHKIYCRLFGNIFPCAEIEFKLIVLK